MKVLIVTSQTQGQRDSDFSWCEDGEPVTVIRTICGLDRMAGPDGGCGCGRSFIGLESGAGTTTARVEDIEGFTRDHLMRQVRAYRERLVLDWNAIGTPDEVEQLLADEVNRLTGLARRFKTGTVVEIRMDKVLKRMRESRS